MTRRCNGFDLDDEDEKAKLEELTTVGRWSKDGWVGAPPYFIAHTDAYHIITAPEHLFFLLFFDDPV